MRAQELSKAMRWVQAGIVMVLICIRMSTAAVAGDSAAIHDSVAVSAVSSKSEPFAFGDFTWLNGNDRRHTALLDSKYITGSVLLDVNYTYSFHHPIDNTVVGSTTLARNNEFEISFLGLGGDLHYGHARGRVMLQLGTRSTVVPRNDFSTTRGQFELANAYRYFSEANAGYHWDTWHGINLDAGIFMSYVGLFSYYNAENWSYQPSFTSDNTPWFFTGLRLQTFPSDRLKVEYWLINGWQTYGKFNNAPGLGFQVLYRPKEMLSVLSNGYVGTDTQDKPGRIRVHSDNSLEIRYFNHPNSFIDRMAFSVTGDLGFENGDGVTAFGGSGGPAQNFVSGMIYNRIWVKNNLFGFTCGGGFIHNPGRYLVLLPTGDAGPNGTHPFTANPGDRFDGWDASMTFDLMPDESQTWRIEIVHRHASVPYFAGSGGVTSPDGYNTTPLPPDWKPDLVQSETRIIFAVLFRF